MMLGVMPDDRFGKRVAFTKPYYFADYRFVVPAGAAEPDDDAPLAVEKGLALRGMRNRRVQELPSLQRILQAVVEGNVHRGYVSASRGSWLAATRWPGKLQFIRNDTADRFPICAAVRKSDDDLKAALEQAFDELAESGQMAEVFARWHIPYEAPKKATLEPARSDGK